MGPSENPPGAFADSCPSSAQLSAGALIDSLGLKGLRRGQAQVSEQHANFIINLGGATASEVLSLIHHIKERARNEKGITLEEEIEVIGEPI